MPNDTAVSPVSEKLPDGLFDTLNGAIVQLGILVKRLPPASVNEPENSQNDKIFLRYRRQETARGLLPERRALQSCMHALAFQQAEVDLLYSPEKKRARYKNLQTCKDVWACSCCAAPITERRARNLEKLFNLVRAAGGEVIHVAFTVRHSRKQSLKTVREALKKARNRFTSHRDGRKLYAAYGVDETVTGLEVTYNLSNGFHPHNHVALLLLKPLTDEQFARMEADFKELWVEVTGLSGGDANYRYGIKLSRDHDAGLGSYISKAGRDEKRDGWTMAREIAKSPAKTRTKTDKGLTPFQLLDLADQGDKHAGRVFQEYARTMRGSRQLVPSKGVKAKYGIDLNESGDVVDSDYEKLLAVEHDVWRVVAKQKLRAELLMAAGRSGGNAEHVEAWLDTMLLFSAGYPTTTRQLMVERVDVNTDIRRYEMASVRDQDVRAQLARMFLDNSSQGWADQNYTAGEANPLDVGSVFAVGVGVAGAPAGGFGKGFCLSQEYEHEPLAATHDAASTGLAGKHERGNIVHAGPGNDLSGTARWLTAAGWKRVQRPGSPDGVSTPGHERSSP